MTGDGHGNGTNETGRAWGIARIAKRPIVVLLGGPSAEHDVSVVSGWAIADALEETGLAVERVFIDLSGGWWFIPSSACKGRPAPGSFDNPRAVGASGPATPARILESLAGRTPRPMVFPALHGPFGEDGTLQALLEAYNLPYAGAGVAASALGMDKILFKRMCRGLGIDVVDWYEVTSDRWGRDPKAVLHDLEAFAERISPSQMILKPARMGSSVGMSIAHSPAERSAALEEAFRYDSLVLVERYLDHPRELEVAVIGNDPSHLHAFGPGEVHPGHEFYDYVAKYSDGVSTTDTQANIDAKLGETVRTIAINAYKAIGCEGFARVDFLLDGHDLYLNEINTIPGFTPISLFPQMAATGLGSFEAVCLRIVELGEEREFKRVKRHLTTADLPR